MQNEYLIKAISGKQEMFFDLCDNKLGLGDGVDEKDGKYAFWVGFAVFHVVRDDIDCEIERLEKAAEIQGVWFDVSNIQDDDGNILEITDMVDTDAFNAITALVRSQIYRKGIPIDSDFMPPFICYLGKIYVEPHFRNKGLGNFIFRNIGEISRSCLSAPLGWTVIYPENEDTTELSRMIKVIKKNGYKKINGGFYVKNYAADDD